MFNNASLWEAGSHEALSSVAFGDRWVRFAATGNPGTFLSSSLPWLSFHLEISKLIFPCIIPPLLAYPDPEWKPFTSEAPTWLAFGTGGKVENEDLKEFEKNMVQFGVRK